VDWTLNGYAGSFIESPEGTDMVRRLEIDRDEFQRIVTDLESKQTFPNPTALWQAVEKTDWAKAQSPRPLTASVANTRAKELGIQCRTKPSKRGIGELTEEQRAAMQAARKNRKPRAEKMRAFASTFEQLRKTVPERFLPLVDRAEKGSLRASIKLNCLECSAYQPGEIKLCVITSCAMFPHRPYQGKVQAAEGAAEPEGSGHDETDEMDEIDEMDETDDLSQ
jgi:hypothetical protein